MTTAVETKILDVVQWADQPVQLKDFIGKFPVPNIVKVTKGQYRNYIGFAKSVHSNLYLYSVSTGKKILAESVKLKEGKRAVLSDQKYAIPLSYQGWFEVLSEDGKAVKAIESIKELATTVLYSKNTEYLVRENIKAFNGLENGELSSEQRVIQVGDVISILGDMWITQNTPKGMVKRKVMACTENSGNDKFYFDYEQKGLFSAVAGQQNISGVHNVQAMLQKFRLPITVRLVNGIIPTKLEKHFTGVFRLLHIYSDETAFLCPLKKDSKMVPVSTREPLKLVHANNFEDVKGLEEFEPIHERCANMYKSFMNSIHLLFSLPEPEAISAVRKKGDLKSDGTGFDVVEEDILFEEVEDIYQYVRDGGPTPPAPRPRPMKSKGPPPLPDKKGSTKAKLAYLGRSLVNKISTKDKEQQPYKESSAKEKEIEPPPVDYFDPPSPPELPNKKDKSAGIDLPDGPQNRKILKKAANSEWDWEEPIYEPLDKIRNQKKNKDKKQEIQLDTSPQLVSDPSENFRMPTVNADTSTDPTLAVTDPSAVQNLRQIYKQQHSLQEGGQNSLEKKKVTEPNTKSIRESISASKKPEVAQEILDQGIKIPEPDYEDNPYSNKPPPVPPKHFDVNDIPSSHSKHSHSSGSDGALAAHNRENDHRIQRSRSQSNAISTSDSAVHRAVPTSAITVSTNSSPNVQGYIRRSPQQRQLPRGVPTTVHIEAPSTAQASHPHSGVPRVSIISQNHSSSHHPPYVAVARVGDSYEDRYSSGNRPVTRANSDHARRKLQSMYL